MDEAELVFCALHMDELTLLQPFPEALREEYQSAYYPYSGIQQFGNTSYLRASGKTRHAAATAGGIAGDCYPVLLCTNRSSKLLVQFVLSWRDCMAGKCDR